MATATGPKISTWAIVEAGSTSVKRVGGKKQPSGWSAAGLEHRRALGLAPGDEVADPLQLHGCHDGPDVGRFVERVTHAQRAHAPLQLGVEALRHTLLHEDAGSGAADLALVEPDGVHHAFHGAVEVGVLEDHEGRLAAEFEAQLLPRAGGLLPDEAADLGRSREGHLVDARMSRQGRARGAVARDDVDDASGQPRLAADLGEGEGGERGELGRLQHDRVAGRERRGDLPGEHQEREVPGDDLPADAHRRMVRELARDQFGPSGVVVEVAGHERDVDVARLADRLAVVEGLQHRQEALTLLDMAGEPVEVPGPDVTGGLWTNPRRRRVPPRRRVDVLRRALGHGRERLVSRRVADREGLAGDGRGEASVDEVTEAAFVRLEPGPRVVVGFGSGTIVHGVEDLFDLGHAGSLMSLRRARARDALSRRWSPSRLFAGRVAGRQAMA